MAKSSILLILPFLLPAFKTEGSFRLPLEIGENKDIFLSKFIEQVNSFGGPQFKNSCSWVVGVSQLPLNFPGNRLFSLFKILFLIDNIRNNICIILYIFKDVKLFLSFLM